jgi:hypothetical protein
MHMFSSSLAVAVEAFQQRLEGHKWMAMPSPAFSRGVAGDGVSGARGAGGEELAPPYVLMEHVPLAVFTNAVLSGLNELRHCALLGLQKPLASLLQAALEQVASTLVVYR